MTSPKPIDDFDWDTQDRLYALKCDIRIGMVNEGFYPPEINHLYWATCTEGRYTGNPWDIVLAVQLADAYGVQYYCDDDKDSRGDWFVVHGFVDWEAA